jgi:hypothetical protein
VSSRAGQCGRILRVLIAARGAWVPLPKIIECAAQYNARIVELRRLGFRITNRTREVQGQRHSWFRLESIPADVSSRGEIENFTVATSSSFPEFGNLAPESYGVD